MVSRRLSPQGRSAGSLRDAEGNRTAQAYHNASDAELWRDEYAWDHHNQLTRIDHYANGNPGQVSWFGYDPFGNRTAKIVDSSGAGATTAPSTYYVYRGDDIAVSYDDADGIDGAQDAPSPTYYLHGPRTDDVIAQDNSDDPAGHTYWSLPDHLGSVRDVVEQTATPGAYGVANHLIYTAFGQVTSQSNPGVWFRYGFTGREADPETGLQHNRARYYDPATGTFISQDPAGFAAGDPNLYRYTGNAPTFRTDPTGLNYTGLGGAGGSSGGSFGGSFGGSYNTIGAFGWGGSTSSGSSSVGSTTDPHEMPASVAPPFRVMLLVTPEFLTGCVGSGSL